MRRRVVLFGLCVLMAMLPAGVAGQPGAPQGGAARKPGDYPLGPDSLPKPGVPKGRLEGPFEFHSKALAGTVRRYWIFVPAQYTGDTPANVLVFQDGQRATNPEGSLRVPQVLENLIASGDIPVTIGIFITPGHRAETVSRQSRHGQSEQPRPGVRLAVGRVHAVPRRRDAAGGGEEVSAD